MWKWFSRRPAPKPPENPERIRQRLEAARLLVNGRKQRNERPSALTAEARPDLWREILPSDEPDATIPYSLPPSRTNDSTLAAALESILQGQKVGAELFTQLYRGGFVFKDPRGQWSITAKGKELIEKHKLLTREGCLVAGVRSAAGWNR